MSDVSNMKLIGSVFCKQYESEAQFYLDDARPSGRRLIVRYGEGYSGRDDLPTVDGQRQFAIGVPDSWTKEDIQELLLWPRKTLPGRAWPAWEIPARDYGSATLFRFWAGEKPE